MTTSQPPAHSRVISTRRLGDSIHAYAVMSALARQGQTASCQIYRPFAPLFAGGPLTVIANDQGTEWAIPGHAHYSGPVHGEHIRQTLFRAAGASPERLRLSPAIPSPSAPRRPFVLICPHTAVPYKEWADARWAQLVEQLLSQGLAVVISGHPGRARLPAPGGARFLDVDVPRLAQVMAQARCLVSPDSGQVHLADALGVPVVGLYAATSAITYGPYGNRRFCIDKHHRLHDNATPYDSSRHRTGAAMDAIGVGEVMQRIEAALSSAAPLDQQPVA